MYTRLLLWGPVFGFMALVLLVPGAAVDPLHQRIWDKASHAVAFGIYGLFCLRAFHGGWTAPRWFPVVTAVLFAVAFGALDEWRQVHLPDRVGSILDWYADAVGVICSAAGYVAVAAFARKRSTA